MPCDGYEHGSRVVVRRRLADSEIRVGAIGQIVAIDRANHLLDVAFKDYGLHRGLDAHCFSLAEGDPGRGASGATA